MKGILGDLVVIKILQKTYAKTMKRRRYKEIVRQQLDNMIAVGSMEPVEESGGTIQLAKLSGVVLPTEVNGSRLKLSRDNPPIYLA